MASKRLIELCLKYFNTTNLYEVLNIKKDAQEKEIKDAYHRMCLKVHPDRVEESEKELATEMFKVLGQIHAILSDPYKRDLYNHTGDVDDSDLKEIDWLRYFDSFLKTITMDDIKTYELMYKGSAEERGDLMLSYLSNEGNMDEILDSIQFAQPEDQERLQGIIRDMISEGEVQDFPAFSQQTEEQQASRVTWMQQRRAQYEQRQKERDEAGGEASGTTPSEQQLVPGSLGYADFLPTLVRRLSESEPVRQEDEDSSGSATTQL